VTTCPALLHTYTEASARAKLARHRKRGEEAFAWHCPLGDHWHVTDRPLREMVPES